MQLVYKQLIIFKATENIASAKTHCSLMTLTSIVDVYKMQRKSERNEG